MPKPHPLRLTLTAGLLVLFGLALFAATHGSHPQPPPALAPASPLPEAAYPWPRAAAYEPLAQRLPPPPGFTRLPVVSASWGEWLRYLPLKPPGSAVLSFQAKIIRPGDASDIAAVVDLDVRKRQECADTLMRLRAEYLLWANRGDEVIFPQPPHGPAISWPSWQQGFRPKLQGGQMRFARTNPTGTSREAFDHYLNCVFTWCDTDTLVAASRRVKPTDIQVGDFFVQGEKRQRNGHAALIVDLARDASGATIALIVQGHQPAQSAQVPSDPTRGPWVSLTPGAPVKIPGSRTFSWQDLRRFRDKPAPAVPPSS